MNEIGGFLELELPTSGDYYPNAVKLNSARSCLRLLIRVLDIRKLYVPAYTCPVIWHAIQAEGCQMEYYPLTPNFLPDFDPNPQEYFLFTNYFGVCSKQVLDLSKKYPRMIVDNSQAFFAANMSLAAFNSPRKFFGLPDGGYLIGDIAWNIPMDQDCSWNRVTHLVKRIDMGANAAYKDFKVNDNALCDEAIKKMSRLTDRLLHAIDYQKVIDRRRQNYLYLHQQLVSQNDLEVPLLPDDVPMVYPLLWRGKGRELKTKLISNHIYVATYWTGQKDPGFGKVLEEDLIPLAIDQRYNLYDMQRIVEVLHG